MITLTYHAEWAGERAAGINPGSEDVDIILKHTDYIDELGCEAIEFWRDSIAQYFDGAHVKFVRWKAQ